MYKHLSTYFVIPALLLLVTSSENSLAQPKDSSALSGSLEKMMVMNGVITMNVDQNRLNGIEAVAGKSAPTALRFDVAPESFFTILVFDNELRATEPGSMKLTPQDNANVPAALRGSFGQLMVERSAWDEASEFVVRDSQTGALLFNVEGNQYHYDPTTHSFAMTDGRLLISEDFAKMLGRPADAGKVVGTFASTASMSTIEIRHLVNGEVRSAVMPAQAVPDVGTNPGPDVIVGDMPSMVQAGSSGTRVGLAVATTSCNLGVVDLDWFALPNNDHPVIPQNLYRMSANTDRIEQIGQGWMKHAFTALTQNICSLGCNGTGGSHLGSGCSDPYDTSLNGSQTGIGSRAWANPFTGFYPATTNPDGQATSRDHTGHTHTGTAHRVLVEQADLNTTLNPGATYFAETQYVTPHEFAWCQGHSHECNMFNNVSYRQFTVSGTTSFSFSPAAATMRTKPAIFAWTGSTSAQIEPAVGIDGIGFVANKVTTPSAGVWHYEYVVYNMNLDRAIQSFSVPLGCGVTISNVGFHAPLPPDPATNDGTLNDAGYSSTPWTASQTGNAITWTCETFAQNQNANAIRWGTAYNFRFDSNKPPQAAQSTVGFFKTGSPNMISIQAPTADPCNPLAITTVVSRKTHGGAGDFDVNLPLSGAPGVECRSTGGNHTFVFTFTNNVLSGNASVTAGTGTVSGSPTFSSNTMTVNLTGVTDAQQIAVTASSVMDSFGQTLPDTAVSANILAGDTSGNKSVNSSDVIMAKQQIGAAVSATNFRNDVNANGTLNATDATLVKGFVGDSVP